MVNEIISYVLNNIWLFVQRKQFLFVWYDEVEKSLQFFEGVLQRGIRNQKFMVGIKFKKSFVEERIIVFQSMGFIYNQGGLVYIVQERLKGKE